MDGKQYESICMSEHQQISCWNNNKIFKLWPAEGKENLFVFKLHQLYWKIKRAEVKTSHLTIKMELFLSEGAFLFVCLFVKEVTKYCIMACNNPLFVRSTEWLKCAGSAADHQPKCSKFQLRPKFDQTISDLFDLKSLWGIHGLL